MKLSKIMKRGTKTNPIITVSTSIKSGQIFEGSREEHLKWIDKNKFKRGTVHHVYIDYGGNNVTYFKATKK